MRLRMYQKLFTYTENDCSKVTRDRCSGLSAARKTSCCHCISTSSSIHAFTMSQENKDYDKNWEIDQEDDNEDDDDDKDDEDDEDDEDNEDDEGDEDDEDNEDDNEDDSEDDSGQDDEEEEENGERESVEEDEYEIDEDFDELIPPSHDDTEPEYTGLDPRGQPLEYYQPDYGPSDDEERGFLDEHQEEQKKRRFYDGNRCLMVLAVLCCCILLIIILGLLLYFLVFRNSNDGPTKSDGSARKPIPTRPPTQPAQMPTPRAPVTSVPFSYPTLPPSTPEPTIGPTSGPTFTPVPTRLVVIEPTKSPTKYPTIEPTKSSAPTREIEDEIVLIPVQDTYIISGFEEGRAHGDEDTFLVQNALDHVNQNPDAYALLEFDMSVVPFAKIKDRRKIAILELTHEVSVLERSNATYSVERLASINVIIETLNYEMFGFPENGIKGPSFSVEPADEKVEIDVTDLIFGGIYEPEDDPLALIMIANYGEEQEAGDRFRSRESQGNEPKLRILLIDSPDGTNTTSPSEMPSEPPSMEPNESGGN